MLAHGIVTIIRSRRRSVAFTAAAPVDADHPEGAWEKPGGEFDPVLAGEITVDEDHGLSPILASRVEPRLRSPSPLVAPTYLLRPAVGDAPGGVGATLRATSLEAPLTRRSMATGELTTTLPNLTKSTTSAENCTGLSV